MATRKAVNQVQVLERYAHKTDGKLNGIVTYCVRSSNGKDFYYTTLVEGHATGCSCPSTSKNGCYHMHGLECKEAGRPFASKSLPVWTMWLLEAGVLVAPQVTKVERIAQEVGISVEQVAEIAVIAAEHKAEMTDGKHTEMCLPIGPRDTKKDIMRKSSLNGAQQSAALLMALPSRRKTA